MSATGSARSEPTEVDAELRNWLERAYKLG